MQNFEQDKAIKYRNGGSIDNTIEVISGRYIGENPRCPLSFKAFSREGFMQISDGRLNIDIGAKYPNAKIGQFAYAMVSIYFHTAHKMFDFGLNCFGPTTIYHNGQYVYTSSTFEEVDSNFKQTIYVDMIEGYNVFFLKLEKCPTGFGCIFGSARDYLNPVAYLSPFVERFGQSGAIFSEICDCDIYESIQVPTGLELETNQDINWYPNTKWSDKENVIFQFNRMYGANTGKCAYGITEFETAYIAQSNEYTFFGLCAGKTTLWVDGNIAFETKSGEFSEKISLKNGRHKIVVKSVSRDDDFGFNLKVFTQTGDEVAFISPCNIKGSNEKWIYIGLFDEGIGYLPFDFENLYQSFESFNGEYVYYRLDAPDFVIRPFTDNVLFGKWNYPLGVTLFGLLRAGKQIGRQDITDYAKSHIKQCVDIYKYGLWDKKTFGYPSVDQKLIELTMLDDCGSCGSTMLEAFGNSNDPAVIEVAHIIADYMANRVERRADGAYYRVQKGKFHDNTMWADDLYMSVPFLSRYYKLTGKIEFLDDAAKQFILYKKYLYLPQENLMAHVYDFKYETSNYIPWGRGNGWVLFSLSEILEVMPNEHKDRPELVKFFRELSEGILSVQGVNGLWHQLLTDNKSFEETSCSCMFVYAMSRGIRFGLYSDNDNQKYFRAIQKAWNGLVSRTIDYKGNVYGVCHGSRYAFKPSYYTKELTWVKNDTHGIGITMLAGIEYKKLLGE